MRDDGASSDLRIGDWVPVPRSEPPVDPAPAPRATAAWSADPIPAPRSEAPWASDPTPAARTEPAASAGDVAEAPSWATDATQRAAAAPWAPNPTPAAPTAAAPWGGDPAPRSAPPLRSDPVPVIRAMPEAAAADPAPPIPTPDTEALPLVPAPRTEAIAPEPGWTEAQETVLLPAYLRGLAPTPTPAAPDVLVPAADGGLQLAPAATLPPAEPAAEPAAEKRTRSGLPPSERNMLIFVTALLAAGALAIVAMGHGALNKHGSPNTTPTATTTAAFVGAPNVDGYCQGLPGKLSSRAPGTGHTAWSCSGSGHTPVTFTPTDVCRAQYGASARAEYTSLGDPKTWRCLR